MPATKEPKLIDCLVLAPITLAGVNYFRNDYALIPEKRVPFFGSRVKPQNRPKSYDEKPETKPAKAEAVKDEVFP